MAINDHISNLLARVRNAQTAKFDKLERPSTGVLENSTSILREERFRKRHPFPLPRGDDGGEGEETRDRRGTALQGLVTGPYVPPGEATMSRIGKVPVAIPAGVTVEGEDGILAPRA